MENQSLNKSLDRFLLIAVLVYSLGFSGAVGFSIVTNEIHHRQMAAVISYSQGKELGFGDLRQAILNLENARSQYFSGIGYFQPGGEKVFLIPTTADVKLFKAPTVWDRITNVRYAQDIQLGDQKDVKIGTLVFLFPRFAYFLHALVLWLGVMAVSIPFLLRLRTNLIKKHQEESLLRKEAALSKQACDVAHNIRSPLAALDVLLDAASSLPEDQRILVRSATSRIRDIANTLSSRPDGSRDQLGVHLLSSIVETIVSEKRVQHRDRTSIEIEAKIAPDSFGLFGRVKPSELKAVLSNLVNNSIEAMDSGRIQVSLSSENNHSVIAVIDSGPGIHPDILPRLTEPGATFGKPGGTGRGLHHAKSTLSTWGGRLEIHSALGLGTTIKAFIPETPAPAWFMPNLAVTSETRIVVLDDDASIHQVWERRFRAARPEANAPTILHTYTPSEFRDAVVKQGGRETLFLVDYELLGSRESGLDLIEEMGISLRSLLVTSHYEEGEILERCERNGVRLIPKVIANLIPIRYCCSGMPSSIDAVLIDDDPFTRTMWQAIATQKGRTLVAFDRSAAFIAGSRQIPRETPIYVDRRLGNEIGDEVSKRISDLGFSHVWLATGEIAETLPHMPWLRGITGKRPPW